VSIIRVGLAETKNFAEGYEAIFGKKSTKEKAEKKEGETDKDAENKKKTAKKKK
jgi:hypothetical protein